MKAKLFIPAILLVACNSSEIKPTPVKTDTLQSPLEPVEVIKNNPDTITPVTKVYFNKRFKDVTVTRIDANTFQIKGLGQIFEANFNWVVEDGHEELKKGFQMTDAGAPEWGKFEFTIEVQKKRPNSTLTLILFESSAMDGSRQYELPIVLE